jgi:carboxyl-terminal processing protease
MAQAIDSTQPAPVHHELYQQVWNLLERDFYGDPPDFEERIHGTVRGLVQSYQDPYTYFVEPQPRVLERDRFRGSFGGIGAYIEQVEEGFLLRPMPDQPAEQAGILVGDRLIAIDDYLIPADASLDSVTAMIRGPVESEVCLDLARKTDPGEEMLTLCVVRVEIQTPSVEWRLLAEAPHVGYLSHTFFNERSVDEMLRGVQELQAAGATHFVLDLRGNPGGLVRTATAMADLWLDEGVVLIERKASGEETLYHSQDGDLLNAAPLVVIVDGGSASASEIVAGALQDRGRATLIGERTFGKGSVQLVHELVDASSLHVTNAHWYTPNGHALEGVGLIPDRLIEPGSDPLQAALSFFENESTVLK